MGVWALAPVPPQVKRDFSVEAIFCLRGFGGRYGEDEDECAFMINKGEGGALRNLPQVRNRGKPGYESRRPCSESPRTGNGDSLSISDLIAQHSRIFKSSWQDTSTRVQRSARESLGHI